MADPFIGTINMFGFPFAPRDWTACNGQLLQISQFTTVYSLLGTYYGGDGRVSFGIPELRGRAPIHYGNHPGSSYNWMIGQVGGTEFNTLSTPNLPSHNHAANFTESGSSLTASKNSGNQLAADNDYYLASQPTLGGDTKIYIDTAPDAANSAALAGLSVAGSVDVSYTGQGSPVNNMGPVLAVNFCMALQGLYPPRN